MKEEGKRKGFISDFVIPIVAAVLGALAGSFYESRHTENAIVEKMGVELEMIKQNDSLAQAIERIKKTVNDKDATISQYESENAELKERISGSGDQVSALEKEVAEEKTKVEGLEQELLNYKFETPDLYVNGDAASAGENSILRFKDQLFYGESILQHFFAEGKVQYENGRLDMSTEGARVVVNPLLKGRTDLTTMEVTHNDSLEVGVLVDNEGNKHNSSITTKFPDRRFIEYRLNKQYKYFECTAFVPNEALQYSDSVSYWNTATITITTDDGLELWTTDKISPHSEVQKSGLIEISNSTYIRITLRYN